MTTTITTLEKKYKEACEKVRNYARANFIFDLLDADNYYLDLLIEREEAHIELKRAQVNDDPYFNYRYLPVMNHRIQQFKNMKTNNRFLGGRL